jgi:hypothetical protein
MEAAGCSQTTRLHGVTSQNTAIFIVTAVLTDGLIGRREIIRINEAKDRPKRQIKNLENN